MVIYYFASVREQLGIESEVIENDFTNIASLIAFLSDRGKVWHDILNSEQTLVSIDKNMSTKDDEIKKDSEVAFFPFMTGG